LTSFIRDRAASTPEMMEAFSDDALLRAVLAFEIALAEATAAEGLINAADLAAIREACTTRFDIPALAEQTAHAGTLAIPMVAALRERIAAKSPGSAKALHLGATSQDVLDTALMLQAKMGVVLIERDLRHLTRDLTALAERHAATPMLGRTLLQGARPITFGLKAAQWLLGVHAAARRLRLEVKNALTLQFGGASGTRAGLGGQGASVSRRMAATLGLTDPPAPWHSRRDGIAGLASALGILIGALAKIARDVSLLAQDEIGEAFEPKLPGRGGSSAMAHKRNPTGCQVALSAQSRAPGLVSSILGAMAQEHERGLGGWQAEAPTLADLFLIAHGSLAAMGPVIAGIELHTDLMQRNLAKAGVGSDIGEAVQLVARILSDMNKEG